MCEDSVASWSVAVFVLRKPPDFFFFPLPLPCHLLLLIPPLMTANAPPATTLMLSPHLETLILDEGVFDVMNEREADPVHVAVGRELPRQRGRGRHGRRRRGGGGQTRGGSEAGGRRSQMMASRPPTRPPSRMVTPAPGRFVSVVVAVGINVVVGCRVPFAIG